jgi:hypothetical protein
LPNFRAQRGTSRRRRHCNHRHQGNRTDAATAAML